jgi:hypothetical protein
MYCHCLSISGTLLGRLARDKHYSLLGPFISYEENEVFFYTSEASEALSENIRLGWKWLLITDPVAYFITVIITTVKKFYKTCPKVDITNKKKAMLGRIKINFLRSS